MEAHRNPARNQDFLITNLPQEIIFEILWKLPFPTIQTCKRVCKSWRDLVELSDFATWHLSKSSSTSFLAVINDLKSYKPPYNYKVCALLDEPHGRGSTVISQLSFLKEQRWTGGLVLHSSVNGLLFLLEKSQIPSLFICNPVTREYIERPCPHPLSLPHPQGALSYTRVYGFGVSKITGHYKIVKIYTRLEVFIYTLGTGLWRSINIDACRSQFEYRENEAGVFLNGNLHWLVYDSENNLWTSCLDLETELFTSFSPLPLVPGSKRYLLSALEGRLCLCDNSPTDEVAIWFMNKYGDENTWTKELLIKRPLDRVYVAHFPAKVYRGYLFPVKVFKDGDILFAGANSTKTRFLDFGSSRLFCYSIKNKTLEEYDLDGRCSYCYSNVVIYTPSLVSLKTLGVRCVGSF